ncbi:MAG: hypothetical protein O2819_09105 [Planctomycetota bacterium]|nr:hypothetical protein [Planctomycetota bacterium]MDA1105707.1 hypothetical protein [Planctomycetota bacterium]
MTDRPLKSVPSRALRLATRLATRLASRLATLIVACLTVCAPHAAMAGSELGIALPAGFQVASSPPIAIRGGLLMIDVTRSDAAVPWPDSVACTMDGRNIDPATMLAVTELLDRGVPSWTDPARWIAAAEPKDAARAWLVVRIPVDTASPLQLRGPHRSDQGADQSLRAVVVNPPAIGTLGWSPTRATPAQGHALAARHAPTEHFRARLSERGQGRPAPVPTGFEPDRLLADALADRWDAVLLSIDAVDPLSAQRLIHALASVATGTAEDGAELAVASWMADPASLDLLLTQTEGALRSGSRDRAAALARDWVETQPLVGLWVERCDPSGVVLGVVNGGLENRVLDATWLGGAVSTTIPVLSGEYRKALISWPAPGADVSTLLVKGPSREWRLQLPGPSVAASPPGIRFGPFFADATLPTAAAGVGAIAPDAWATEATLRRRPGGWEFFIQARRPESDSGRDEVVITLPAADVRIGILESGAPRLDLISTGQPLAAGASVVAQCEQASGRDSWVATVRIPSDWIGGARPAPGTVVPVGLSRRIAGIGRFAAIRPLLPWNERGHELWLDVGAWPLPDQNDAEGIAATIPGIAPSPAGP